MSTETKDWIGDVEVFRHGGGGFGAAINGANAFHPAPLGDHNKPLCQFRIAHGLPSREAAEEAAREWVSRQAEALGLFRDRDARIAELEQDLQSTTDSLGHSSREAEAAIREKQELLAGVNLQLKEIERLRDRIAELEAQVRTAAPAELVELLDRLSPPGHGIAMKGDPTETLHTGHDVYLAQRVRAWLHNQAPAPAVPEGFHIKKDGEDIRIALGDLEPDGRLPPAAKGIAVWVGPSSNEPELEVLYRLADALLAAAPEPAGEPCRTINIDDIVAWADGVQGALGTEHANRVTEREAAASRAVMAAIASAPDRCPHGVRRPHECKECADAVPASEALEWAEREFAAARQSPGEPVPVETTAEESSVDAGEPRRFETPQEFIQWLRSVRAYGSDSEDTWDAAAHAATHIEDMLESGALCPACGSWHVYEDRVDQAKGVLHCDDCGHEFPNPPSAEGDSE